MQAEFDVYCGIDVGKSHHHLCALDRAGVKVVNRGVANDEAALRTVFEALAERGRVLVVVDQVSGPRWPWRSPGTWAWRWPTCRG